MRSIDTGPALIGLGLVILVAGTWVPLLPVVTAMAMLTLGATIATLARCRYSPTAGSPLLMIHTATYSALYVTFVGATLHATVASPATHPVTITAADLALSVIPITLAIQKITKYFCAE
jgi:hypothetical protein